MRWQGVSMQQPDIETPNLVLRPFSQADARQVQLLAGDPHIARMTSNVPHPYRDGMAEAWIAAHAQQFQQRSAVIFAITRKANGELVGAVSLTQMMTNLGYWVGVPFWGQGIGSEAAKHLVAYGFNELGLPELHAQHYLHNFASQSIIKKTGFIFQKHVELNVRGVPTVLKQYRQQNPCWSGKEPTP